MEYILIIAWVGFMALVQKNGRFQRSEIVLDSGKYRYPMWFAIVMFIPIIWIVGHRGLGFGDTYGYVSNFLNMPDNLGGIPHYISKVQKDYGFSVLSCIIKSVIGNNKVLYLSVIAIIQSIPLLTVYRKYSSNYIISIFLFLASTDYVAWMCNGMRQFTAATIIFSTTTLILRKKYIPTLFIIIMASTMHKSALIMIPMVFIVQGKAWNKKTLLVIVLAIVFIVFVGQATGIMDEALADTQYENVVSDYTSFDDDGTNPLRVLVFSMPAILSFFLRKKINSLDDPVINLCTNMSIISMGLYVVSMFTSGIFIGRLPIYVSLYGYILLPWEIENLFTFNKKISYTIMIGAYLVFYYMQMHFVNGLI